MQVGLVGTEGRFLAYYAHYHYPQSVENGYTHDCQCKGYKTQIGSYIAVMGIARKDVDDKYREDDAQSKCAGIAYKHLGVLAKDIVAEEWYE
jgi:hypothetical protein